MGKISKSRKVDALKVAVCLVIFGAIGFYGRYMYLQELRAAREDFWNESVSRKLQVIDFALAFCADYLPSDSDIVGQRRLITGKKSVNVLYENSCAELIGKLFLEMKQLGFPDRTEGLLGEMVGVVSWIEMLESKVDVASIQKIEELKEVLDIEVEHRLRRWKRVVDGV